MYCSSQLIDFIHQHFIADFYGGKIRYVWYISKIADIFCEGQSLNIWYVHFLLNYLCSCGYLCVTVSLSWGAKRASLGQTLMKFLLCNLPAAITEIFCTCFSCAWLELSHLLSII